MPGLAGMIDSNFRMKATGNSTENGECGDVQPFLHDYGSQRGALTLGVEEEFFLVDMETGSPVGLAGEVSARVADQFGFGAAAEIYPSMIEIRTGVCKSLGQVREQLTGLRSATAAAAAEFGAGLLASSTYPPEHFREEMVRPIARYIRQLNDYRRLIIKQHITGCHIHVGISNPDDAIQVMNRAMLSPLLALRPTLRSGKAPIPDTNPGGLWSGHAGPCRGSLQSFMVEPITTRLWPI